MKRDELERAISAAVDISDAGTEPTRHNVTDALQRRGVTVEPSTLDEALIGVLVLHRWIVEPGDGLDGGSKRRSRSRSAGSRGTQRRAA